jgi:hypothetical protein
MADTIAMSADTLLRPTEQVEQTRMAAQFKDGAE